MITTLFRTVIIYFVLIITIRLMGKRQIGELQLSELIITFLLSEIASVPITDRSASLFDAIIPITYLLLIELAVSYILMKNNFLRKLLVGTPSVLILRGKLIQKELKKNRIEVEELLAAMRQSGCVAVDEVRYAILEENGTISIIPNRTDSPPNCRDLNLTVEENGIAHPVILDGVIIKENLDIIGWNKARLTHEIAKKHTELEHIFLMTVDDCGKITLIERNMN